MAARMIGLVSKLFHAEDGAPVYFLHLDESDCWCVIGLSARDPETSVLGCGESPEAAYRDWRKAAG